MWPQHPAPQTTQPQPLLLHLKLLLPLLHHHTSPLFLDLRNLQSVPHAAQTLLLIGCTRCAGIAFASARLGRSSARAPNLRKHGLQVGGGGSNARGVNGFSRRIVIHSIAADTGGGAL